nr:RNA-directed DNA polymerase, eukaryota, reverse transcriptase zinc-binding domain protein [Tanacetum cinerariifolium]
CSSTWLDIVRDTTELNRQGIDLCGFIKKKVGNGEETSFLNDVWTGEASLKSLYPRVYALESCKNNSVASKMAHANIGFSLRHTPRGGAELDQFSAMSSIVEGIYLPIMQDRWIWSLTGPGEFSIASVRSLIDDHKLSDVSSKTRWIKAVPGKDRIKSAIQAGSYQDRRYDRRIGSDRIA